LKLSEFGAQFSVCANPLRYHGCRRSSKQYIADTYRQSAADPEILLSAADSLLTSHAAFAARNQPSGAPEIPELLLLPAFRSSSPPVTNIQPIPLCLHPVRAEEPSSSNYRIQRLETAATVPPATAQVSPIVPRRTAILRQRQTRSGSRLDRLAVATEIPKQRRLWNCRLCSLTLTSAKAKYDHINGRMHKARIEAQQDHYCEHSNQKFSSALDLERHIQGRRHLKVVSSRNH
jgi:hypothetical protein